MKLLVIKCLRISCNILIQCMCVCVGHNSKMMRIILHTKLFSIVLKEKQTLLAQHIIMEYISTPYVAGM